MLTESGSKSPFVLRNVYKKKPTMFQAYHVQAVEYMVFTPY